MNRLETSFAGLTLRNPIIVASSGLTDTAKKNAKLARAGAGAIVLKSLFEEQIMLDASSEIPEFNHAEAGEYFLAYYKGHKVAQYLELIRETKASVDIPVIASVNCYTNDSWVEFAQEIEKAGADALEINILAHQTTVDYVYGSFEQRHVDILKHLKELVHLPIIMKLGNNLTNPIALVDQLQQAGASAVVLFNRFYQPDIDIEYMTQSHGSVFTTPSDLATTLRWVGIASAQVDIDVVASGGVGSPTDIVKCILAGSSAVEVCSAVYSEGINFIKDALDMLEEWSQEKQIDRLMDVCGKLNIKNVEGVNTFERSQFLRYFAQREV